MCLYVDTWGVCAHACRCFGSEEGVNPWELELLKKVVQSLGCGLVVDTKDMLMGNPVLREFTSSERNNHPRTSDIQKVRK